ncbi:MAG: hypothetical protein KBT07_09360 [Clostridiales bacterium]|nr:hypothetical protein [Candidatus Scatonaster coprocaballi]
MMVRIDEILPERDTLGKHLYHLSEQTVCTPIGAKTVKLVRVAPKTPADISATKIRIRRKEFYGE